MSRKLTLILAVLSFLLSAACAYLAIPRPVEALVAAEPLKQLGELGQGVTVPVEFELVNHCPETVEIVDVLKSCSCVSTDFSKSSLSPGEGTPLKIHWSTGAARGPFGSNIGVVYKRAGQEKRQMTKLRIEAKVLPDIEYQPAQLVFAAGKMAKQVVKFWPGRDPKAAVKRAYSTHSAFAARLLGENTPVEVTFDPSKWLEENSAMELIVETSSANEPRITVPLIVKHSN